ncbi:D-2-hydroxyacid dehydrogenase [Microlunatus soli]|uniref:Phosphoglycerate dehydrogenase n=1 Tax=Microlunatus soli TaxID=630515 RepID=A0A1H1R2N2_9ACTN|nr:D-2-hydroxyacid dehydrogenase [Microlunatus soli]SDS29775.1 Phosphoglycerate dehydrogenase [Microlunatus soli]
MNAKGLLLAQPELPGALDRVRAIAAGRLVTLIEPYGPGTRLDRDLLADTEVLFADLPPDNVADATGLRWLQLGSHGYGQLAGRRLPAGCVVTNASGVNDIPIAEWCVMMMLALSRDLPGMLTAQQDRRWDRAPIFQNELRGKRLGLWGYGNIGRELAGLGHALGLTVTALSRSGSADRGLRYHSDRAIPAVTVDRMYPPGAEAEFLAELDFLVLTLPLTSATQAMVDAETLALLPPTAYLLNPARAGIVDEQALLHALRAGTIAGAALDDHYRTPMSADDPFWELPNTISTAHISGSTGSPHFRARIWDLFGANLERWQQGEQLTNVIDRADLELAAS